ncbi:hypothetical protein LYSHEL_22230 [Lysobacter helvus]|uniref:DUF2950 domain-containing protein n=2 Tax=Lysobacteraceae TaxID=32033 RepID=A0ABM7Q773_9GAMM|nr:MULTISPECIES: DUF2950 domain-containing protein [Lysobacter]BCT93200.1 hypothetical protein LYSCAS_22240 [Lysobacter caseinilyticus]BCT96352.1 hypothetical protein LYSHEL_22230 [Lysobacter helvus]
MHHAALRIPRTLLLMAALACTPAFAQQAYPTTDAAAQAFVDALGTQKADQAKLAALLGKDWRTFIPIEGVERTDVDAFLKAYGEKHAIQTGSDGTAHLVVGTNTTWTLPIPLAKDAKGWHFDTRAAADEIRVRRIGRNEDAAIEAAKAYHDAQMDYAEEDRNGDGVMEYARKFFSTDGKHDGLYWAEDDSGEISPLGPLFGDATPGSDWHGYHFRILEAQGPSAPGGAYNYKLGDNMSRGFALIAWPAKYDDTGVMSFMISHDGTLFQKDLGPGGEAQAKSMKAFDPDSSWSEVPASAQ